MNDLGGSMNLCIFLPTGETFSFKDVEIIASNETALVFNYIAMSDGKKKQAIFIKANMAGWSTYRG